MSKSGYLALDRHIRCLVMLPCLLLLTASASAEAQRTRVGFRMGYNFQTRDPLLSTDVSLPVTRQLEFYPSVDVYFPDRGSRTGFNGDLRYRVATVAGPSLYVGGGLNIMNRSVDTRSNTDVGASVLLGLESRTGAVRPYAEGRVLMHDTNAFQLVGGLSLTLGGP